MDVCEDMFDHPLRPTIGISTDSFRACFSYRNLSRSAIDRCRGREDDVLGIMFTEDIKENQRSIDVVLVVLERERKGLTDRLESGKVDIGIKVISVQMVSRPGRSRISTL